MGLSYRCFFSGGGRRALGRLLMLALLAGLAACNRDPAWYTARIMTDRASCVAATVDARGDVLIVGSFSDTLRLGETTLASAGSEDVFVAKWSPASRRFVWACRAGGPGQDRARAVAVHGTSVYVAGVFRSVALDAGRDTLANFMGDSLTENIRPVGQAASADGFVAKLTDAGNTGEFRWMQRAGGAADDEITALAVAGPSIYVAGSFKSETVGFGRHALINTGIEHAQEVFGIKEASEDMFVAKLTDAGARGSYMWVQQAGGSWFDRADALAVSGTSVYVAGSFSGVASFGDRPLTAPAGDNHTAFVAKLTDAGAHGGFVWARRAAILRSDRATAVAVTKPIMMGSHAAAVVASGADVYVAGSVGSNYASNAFVTKLTDAGASARFRWGQRIDAPKSANINAVAVRGASVYVAGSFRGTATFGSTSLTSAEDLTSAEHSDVFLAELVDAGRTGSISWAERAGDTGPDGVSALVIGNSRIYVAGSSHYRGFLAYRPLPNEAAQPALRR